MIVLYILFVGLAAAQICSLPGPAFPAPRQAGKSAVFNQATADFLHSLNEILNPSTKSAPIINPDLTSFAIQVYSSHHSTPLFEHYHTTPSVRNNTGGVKIVDEDTVFRIGSVSKLWTVLLLLIENGFSTFYEPVSKYIPEIRQAIEDVQNDETAFDAINIVQWEEVTIGELASHMSGLERSFGLGDIASHPPSQIPAALPPLQDSQIPECGFVPTCRRSQFFTEMIRRHPIFPTSSGPAYSNDAFQLLGYVIENITAQPVEQLLDERLIRPLNLSHSSYSKPADDIGIIPGPPNTTTWNVQMDDLSPAGAFYSSAKDLSTLGRAILNNDLLPPGLTRRWLKPVAHTPDPTFSVGYPWEIFSLNGSTRTDLYTKSGDIGSYSAMTGLSPNHDVGFTVLAAGEKTTVAVWQLADLITTIIIPALDSVAREEANSHFAGTYTSNTDNSSLTLTTDTGPGLRISHWINRDEDILQTLASMQPSTPETLPLDIRLYPTGLKSAGKISFRSAVSGVSPTGPATGPLTSACKAWILVDGQVYGSVALDEFAFEIGEDGDAARVSPRALRTSLDRVRV
ncbi:beta-lactamase/transpeptidase-like protein [Aspergillus crustosus]